MHSQLALCALTGFSNFTSTFSQKMNVFLSMTLNFDLWPWPTRDKINHRAKCLEQRSLGFIRKLSSGQTDAHNWPIALCDQQTGRKWLNQPARFSTQSHKQKTGWLQYKLSTLHSFTAKLRIFNPMDYRPVKVRIRASLLPYCDMRTRRLPPPQIRLLLTIMRVYNLYLLTYLLTYLFTY